MKSTSAILVLAATLATTASLFAIGGVACPVVPTTTPEAVCRAASTIPSVYNLCMLMLHASPPNGKVTVYAAAAARAAALSCHNTVNAVHAMLQERWLPQPQRNAWAGCIADLDKAKQALSRVAGQLDSCLFSQIGQGYTEALGALDHCTALLVRVGETSTAWYGMVKGDKDKTLLAYQLARPVMP